MRKGWLLDYNPYPLAAKWQRSDCLTLQNWGHRLVCYSYVKEIMSSGHLCYKWSKFETFTAFAIPLQGGTEIVLVCCTQCLLRTKKVAKQIRYSSEHSIRNCYSPFLFRKSWHVQVNFYSVYAIGIFYYKKLGSFFLAS